MNGNLSLKSLGPQLRRLGITLTRYAGMGFFLLLAALYGFILFQINSLSSAQPQQSAVQAQVNAARIPKVDSKVASQLMSLEDKSSSVKALFDQARQSPFQE